jgi:hypothetical protein
MMCLHHHMQDMVVQKYPIIRCVTVVTNGKEMQQLQGLTGSKQLPSKSHNIRSV